MDTRIKGYIVTQDDFRANPLDAVQKANKAPVLIVDAQGKKVAYLSNVRITCEDMALEYGSCPCVDCED